MDHIHKYIDQNNIVYIKLIELRERELDIEQKKLQIELCKLQNNDMARAVKTENIKQTPSDTKPVTITNNVAPSDNDSRSLVNSILRSIDWIRAHPPIIVEKAIEYHNKYIAYESNTLPEYIDFNAIVSRILNKSISFDGTNHLWL